MTILDSREDMKALDPSNVLGSIGLFPDQCIDAWNSAAKTVFPESYRHAQNIVVAGMGGSRFTPRTIKELFADAIPVPYEIIDGYDLPGYVNEHTLVLLSSYSGSTEEVISCGKQALGLNAMLTGIACGGAVIELLKEHALPYYQFQPSANPCGQPRVGGGYLLMGHLAFLSALGYLSIPEQDIRSSIDTLRSYGETVGPDKPVPENEAKQLALALKDKHPFLIAGEFLRGAVNGFANQLNETAKLISDFRYIPELNHHLMEGLMHPDALKENALFLFITSHLYSKRIQKRFIITEDVVRRQHIATRTLTLPGETKFQQVLALYALASYTAYYCAMEYGVNPVSIPWVDYFKAELAK